ncbi:MAG: HD domain-containing protein, partial [Chloroflexota bacterium]
ADDLRREAKREAESHAMQQLTALLPGTAAEALESLWAELSARETPEAQFVKELDRLETYFQSREYALAFPDLAFGSFAAEVQETLTTPMLQELRDAITAATTPDPQD